MPMGACGRSAEVSFATVIRFGVQNAQDDGDGRGLGARAIQLRLELTLEGPIARTVVFDIAELGRRARRS